MNDIKRRPLSNRIPDHVGIDVKFCTKSFNKLWNVLIPDICDNINILRCPGHSM